jgi:uncharacterized LabA/DUF88 family protein
MLDLLRTYYFASVPANVHPDDAVKLEDQRKFYTMLSESLGFELMLHEIDFRGHYMAMQDRIERENEPNFMPKERTVDMALGVNMLYLAAIDAYDIAIAVLGDADYQPALDRVRQLGKRILMFTIEGSAAYDYLYPRPNLRYCDFPVVRFQDHLRELRLTPKQDRDRHVYQYSCAKCGKEFYSTYKAPPRQNMYCDEHRIWRDREAGYMISANDHGRSGDNGTKTAIVEGAAGIFEKQPVSTEDTIDVKIGENVEAETPTNGQYVEGNAGDQRVKTDESGGNDFAAGNPVLVTDQSGKPVESSTGQDR